MTSANLSTAQATQRNSEDYINRFSTLSRSGIGVILTKTREPLRAIHMLREYCAALRTPFRVWTMSQGWATYDLSNPDAVPEHDGTINPVDALKKIGDANSGFEDNSVFVMMYPHKAMSQAFLMVQIVKEYTRLLSESDKRLVLLMPPSYQLPEELEDDIVSLDFDVPSYAELKDNYSAMMALIKDMGGGKNKKSQVPEFSDVDIDRIIAAGAGMTSEEFNNALARAITENRDKLPNVGVTDIANVIMNVKTEMVRKSDVLEVMEPGSLEDIGGLDNLKEWIAKRAHCFGQEARDFGIDPPKGILLAGPPGTGKSLAAKAIGCVLGIPALRFDVGRVFNSLVGKSEERVRSALKMVDAMAPCVLMIDEADKAFAGQAGGGSSGDSGVGMRVLGAILTWMQETKSPVFVVVTANRVQNLPTEFLRRGRLDEIFSVTVPNEHEVREILEIHLRKRGKDPSKVTDLDVAIQKSAGYVASELEGSVKDAIIEAFVGKVPITGELIAGQLDNMVPISEAFKEDFEGMRLWAANNARPASRDASGSTAPESRRRRAKAAVATGGKRGGDFAGAAPAGPGLDG